MRRKTYYKKKRGRKKGEGIPYIYNNRVYLGKRPFKNYSSFVRKRWRRYWTLMIIIRKYRRRTNRKYKIKYKRKIRGRGVFGDAFKTLGSFGKLYYKALGRK